MKTADYEKATATNERELRKTLGPPAPGYIRCRFLRDGAGRFRTGQVKDLFSNAANVWITRGVCVPIDFELDDLTEKAKRRLIEDKVLTADGQKKKRRGRPRKER